MGLIRLTHPAIMMDLPVLGLSQQSSSSSILPFSSWSLVCWVLCFLDLLFSALLLVPPGHSPHRASDLTCPSSPICPRPLLPRSGLGGVIYLAPVTSFNYSGLTALEFATTTSPPNYLDCDYREVTSHHHEQPQAKNRDGCESPFRRARNKAFKVPANANRSFRLH